MPFSHWSSLVLSIVLYWPHACLWTTHLPSPQLYHILFFIESSLLTVFRQLLFIFPSQNSLHQAVSTVKYASKCFDHCMYLIWELKPRPHAELCSSPCRTISFLFCNFRVWVHSRHSALTNFSMPLPSFSYWKESLKEIHCPCISWLGMLTKSSGKLWPSWKDFVIKIKESGFVCWFVCLIQHMIQGDHQISSISLISVAFSSVSVFVS